MTYLVNELNINWRCEHTWVRSSKNTGWCLLGCAIGDIGTILYFQLMGIDWPVWLIMTLAIINGIITSIILETFILSKQMELRQAFKTAIGMSLISMVSIHQYQKLISLLQFLLHLNNLLYLELFQFQLSDHQYLKN